MTIIARVACRQMRSLPLCRAGRRAMIVATRAVAMMVMVLMMIVIVAAMHVPLP
jgi:hypothetical protein